MPAWIEPAYTPYICDGLLSYTRGEGCIDQPGRIAFFAIINRTYTFADLNDPAEWASLLSSGNAVIVPVSGELPLPSPVEQPGKGLAAFRLIGFDWTFTGQFDNLDENLELLHRLNFDEGKYGVMMITRDMRAFVPLDVNGNWLSITWHGMPVIPTEITQQRYGQINGKWQAKQMIYSAPVPLAVFETV